MQTLRFASVHLLLSLLACSLAKAAATAKVHSVTLGPVRKVPYTPPDASHAMPQNKSPDGRISDALTLKIRPLFVDARQREWTTGELHDVTDRSFTIRRALRINDALPGDATARWVWQPGPWLLVDRATGRVAALHLPDFDPMVSDVAWFRDYGAYCGVAATAKGGLYAIVAQLGARKAIVQKPLAHWPPSATQSEDHFGPPCLPAVWQREPMRVTMQMTGSDPITFDVVGSTSLIEDGDTDDQ